MKVAPTDNGQWNVTVADARTKRQETGTYDAVMVCNGHYRDPFTPRIEGQERFKGRQWHSHDYRSPEEFQGKKVLVLGAGPSGRDIAVQIATVAKKVHKCRICSIEYVTKASNKNRKIEMKYF